MTDLIRNNLYGTIQESCSRLYPGCRVQILNYIDTTHQYRVRNIESMYVCDINEQDVCIDDKIGD